MAAAKTQGTVKPASPYDPDRAAGDLRKAMKGLGTDEAGIIRVLSAHTIAQRLEIKKSFKTQFGKDLGSELKSEISGNFETLCLALIESPLHYDVKELHDAISGAGTNERTLIEILCSRSNAEIEEIKKQYKIKYKSDLEKDVMGDTSGHLKRLLVSQLAANRTQGCAVDKDLAKKDAEEFYEAGAGKFGTDESTFNRILCLRSHAQLVAMFDAYNAKYGKTIEKVISAETSGYIEDGYLAIVEVARSKAAFFAERLYKSMKGGGTKDRTLIRVVVTRCEIDMVEIKDCFQRTYGKSLASFIKGDCSGDYRKCLMALVGE